MLPTHAEELMQSSGSSWPKADNSCLILGNLTGMWDGSRVVCLLLNQVPATLCLVTYYSCWYSNPKNMSAWSILNTFSKPHFQIMRTFKIRGKLHKHVREKSKWPSVQLVLCPAAGLEADQHQHLHLGVMIPSLHAFEPSTVCQFVLSHIGL